MNYIVAFSFIDGGSWRKPPTYLQSLTKISTYLYILFTSLDHHGRDRMVAGLTTTYAIIVSLNPAQARYTRYNIM